jgi:23S rRNA (adenine2503-C2)-methyltransferase
VPVPAPITPDVLTLPRRAAAGEQARPNLVGLGREALRAALVDAGTPEGQAAMRTRQLWQWIYHRGARDFAAMTDLARDYRALLPDAFVIDRPEIVTRQVSADGTRKYLLRIAGGHEVETVYIPERTAARSASRARSAAR